MRYKLTYGQGPTGTWHVLKRAPADPNDTWIPSACNLVMAYPRSVLPDLTQVCGRCQQTTYVRRMEYMAETETR